MSTAQPSADRASAANGPAVYGAAAQAHPTAATTASPPTSSRSVSGAAAQRLRILVVDDNRAAADMLGMVVRMLGHDVRTAGDGEEGMRLAGEFLPDLILMDVGMPKMDGCTAARLIRQQPWGQTVTLVALTGWGQHEDKQRTKAAGFDYHLVKPAEPAELQRLLAMQHPRHATVSGPHPFSHPASPSQLRSNGMQ
jgi:CheY-like chemotaxis protein